MSGSAPSRAWAWIKNAVAAAPRRKENRPSYVNTSGATWAMVRSIPSAVFLAGATLSAYVLSVQYLEGFLSYYAARPEWFDLSLLQLLAFSWRGVLLSSSLVAYAFLSMMTFHLSWREFTMWTLIVLPAIYSWMHKYFGPLAAQDHRLTVIVWAALSLAAGLGARIFVRRVMARRKPTPLDLPENQLAIAAATLKVTPDQLGIDETSWAAATNYGKPAPSWVLGLVMVFLLLFLAAEFAFKVGRADAEISVSKQAGWVLGSNEASRNARMELVLSDGKVTLIRRTVADEVFVDVVGLETGTLTRLISKPGQSSLPPNQVPP